MLNPTSSNRLRVVLWGAGRVGRAVGWAVCRDAGLQLVGARVHDEREVGRDVGELLGGDPLGVHATDDDGAVLALDADCVVLCPPRGAPPEALDELVRRVLASVKDVVSTATHQHPLFHGAPDGAAERFRLACEAGQSTLHVTGLFPELMVERLALTLARALGRTEHVRVVQAIDVARAGDERVAQPSVITSRPSRLGGPMLTIEERPRTGDAPQEAGGPFGAFTAPFGYVVEVSGEPSRLSAQLQFSPTENGADPTVHVTARAVVQALRAVHDAPPGLLVERSAPRYQLDTRMPSEPVSRPREAKRSAARRRRVVIWGPGEIGGAVTRAALERDDIEIVGAKVFNPAKHGQDLGQLVGVGPIGVRATRSKREILALDADCVIVTPQPRAIVEGLDDDVLELLASGKNVVTSAAYHNVTMPNWLASAQTPMALLREAAATHGMARSSLEEVVFGLQRRGMKLLDAGRLSRWAPPVVDAVLAPALARVMPFRATPQRLLEACRSGGASLHGTGVHPSFMAERVGLLVAGMLDEVQHIRFVEAADFSFMPDGMWGGLRALGFGRPAHELGADFLVAKAGDFYYGDVIGNVAHLLYGAPSHAVRVERSFRALPAERRLRVGSTVIERGEAAALHMVHKGYLGDHHFFTNEECWYLGPDREYRGDDLPFGNFRTPISYTLQVRGRPSNIDMQLSMDGTGEAARLLDASATSTADERCALGQTMRKAGITNPITNATAMAILDALPAVCDAAPGIVIDDVRPAYQMLGGDRP